ADLKYLAELSARSFGQAPTFESIRERMQWLLFEGNWHLLSDELIATRLAFYSSAGYQQCEPLIYSRLKRVKEGGPPDMIELEKV
ncbi:hypothetical protein NG726_38935, partial [Pseudomonas sp. MOB-449]|nr:hypothetical protein [Pseudomonas sp. MOB-449]